MKVNTCYKSSWEFIGGTGLDMQKKLEVDLIKAKKRLREDFRELSVPDVPLSQMLQKLTGHSMMICTLHYLVTKEGMKRRVLTNSFDSQCNRQANQHKSKKRNSNRGKGHK